MLRVNLRTAALFYIFSSVFILGCSSPEKKSDTPEGAFAIAQELDKDEMFDEAIRRYQEVKTKYPYSKFATQAELAAADCYYKQESYLESQVAYQTFKELHPKHPQADYVTYKLAMSFFEQLPDTVDRDLTLAQSSILYFDEVLVQYPNSAHVKDAQEKRTDALKRLAGKEAYIAEFYFKRKKFDSALNRYEGLLRRYPNQGFEADALSKAAISAARVGELDRAKKYTKELKDKFPGSRELSEAEKEIRE